MSFSEQSLYFRSFFSEDNLLRIYEERVSEAKFVGLDGISASALRSSVEEEVKTVVKKISSSEYKFTRYREKLLVKSAKKPPRQIAIPTVRDALVLRALCDYVTAFFKDCRMKPPHDVIKRLSSAAHTASQDYCFLRVDVINFYPSIVHEILLEQLKERISDEAGLDLVSKAISTPIGFEEPVHSGVGIPQGLSISNILSMIYLREFDLWAGDIYKYFRYVDDIVVLAPETNVFEIHAKIETYLSKRLRLVTHPLDETSGKSVISRVSDGTEYLGFKVTNSGLSIREKSYKKMFRAIVGCLRTMKGNATAEQVLWKLNLIVTGCRFENRSIGWVFFFRQSSDMRQLHRMDTFMVKQMGKYGLYQTTAKVKSFVKAYREIRFNRKNTSYIPDFDNFKLDDKMHVVSLIRGYSTKRVARMTPEEIDALYWEIVSRQVAKMENETVDFGTNSGGS